MTSQAPHLALKLVGLLLLTALVAGSVSCRSAPTQKTIQADALTQALDATNDALLRSRAEQLAQARDDLHRVVARYNPANCECPPFEVFVAGQWQRVGLLWVEVAPNALERVERLQNTASDTARGGRHPLYLFVARLTGERRTAPNELDYDLIVVSDAQEIGVVPLDRALALTSGSNSEELPLPDVAQKAPKTPEGVTPSEPAPAEPTPDNTEPSEVGEDETEVTE